MDRTVSLVAAVLVSVGVFTWLAGPLLEARFGTEALLASYAALALAAGGLTYVLLSDGAPESTRDRSITDAGTVEATIELEDVKVDEEMEQLKNE